MKPAFDPRDWQPFTFRGVAALATGPPRRLFKVQILAGLCVVGSLAWFLGKAWWPVIDVSAEQLPIQAAIRGQRLVWEGANPLRLGENTFLAVTIDLEGNSARTSTSDLQVELVRDGVRFHSLFGHVTVPYPPGYVVLLSRLEFQAWWGAWRWPLLAAVSGAAFVSLMTGWFVLAACYAAWVWLFGFFADRSATPMICWRLAAAALAPSAVLVGAAILLYGLHRLNLVGLLFALALQMVIGWVYLLLAPFWLPPHSAKVARRRNPFRR
jgi:hypothetical protein